MSTVLTIKELLERNKSATIPYPFFSPKKDLAKIAIRKFAADYKGLPYVSEFPNLNTVKVLVGIFLLSPPNEITHFSLYLQSSYLQLLSHLRRSAMRARAIPWSSAHGYVLLIDFLSPLSQHHSDESLFATQTASSFETCAATSDPT